MIIKLDKKFYNLAKTVDFTELEDKIRFIDASFSIELDEVPVKLIDYLGEEFEKPSIDALLDCIGDEVVESGLSDDQNTILQRGQDLYNLYDIIYYNL